MSDPTFEVTTLLDDPFYTGHGAPAEEEVGLPYAVDGRGFILDYSQHMSIYHRYQRQSIQLLNSQQASSGGDQALIAPEVWRRSIEGWNQGTGQRRYDRDTSLPFRSFDSQGVDPWDPWNLSLLRETGKIQAVGAGRLMMTTVGPGNLVAIKGTDLYWWVDLTSAPTHVTTGSTIVDACSDGVNLYTIDNTGAVLKWTAPGSNTAFVTVTGTDPNRPLLRYVKGFLIAAAGPKLWDITAGSAAAIYTHPLASFTWRDACDGPGFVYLVGGVGDRWGVYAMPPKTDASSFDPPINAAPIPDGESAYAIGSYMNYVLIGTSGGWRFGIPDSSGQVSFGRLIEADQPVRCFEGQGRFVWYGLSQSPGAGERNSGLARADLSVFVDTLAPATAPDLECPVEVGNVVAVTTFYPAGGGEGFRVFAVAGAGIFAEKQTKVVSGWLDQGSIAFNSSDQKMGLYAQVYHDPLIGSVGLDIAYDGQDWFEIGSNENTGSTDMGHAKIAHSFVQAKLRYRLNRDPVSTQQGPTLTRVEFRALPTSPNASEWRLPLIIREQIDYNGVTQERNVSEDKALLYGLVNDRRPFTMREYDQQYEVHATDYLFLGEAPTQDGRDVRGVFVLIVREVG